MKLFASLLLIFFCQILAKLNITELKAPEVDDSASQEMKALSAPCKPGTWVPASGGQIPKGALPIGLNHGKKTYVGRVNHNGNVLPGMLYGSDAYIITNFKHQQPFYNYEIFCGSDSQFMWVPTEKFNVPPNAVIAGKRKFDRLYFCRVNIDGAHIAAGPVYRNRCYIGVDFNNVREKRYFEILAERQPWINTTF